jgi:hypothetical protein
MSLLLKVVAEAIGPVMASFELGPCNLAERDSLRPESSQEHPQEALPGSFDSAHKALRYATDLRSASLRMTTLLGSLQYSKLDMRQVGICGQTELERCWKR